MQDTTTGMEHKEINVLDPVFLTNKHNPLKPTDEFTQLQCFERAKYEQTEFESVWRHYCISIKIGRKARRRWYTQWMADYFMAINHLFKDH